MSGPASTMIELPADPRSPRDARHLVCRTLRSWHLDDVVDVAGLLTSEMVTNALLHAGTPVRLVISLDDHMLRVEAHDQSRDVPEVRAPDFESSTGRGMALINALAADWGARGEPGGKVVWFSLRV